MANYYASCRSNYFKVIDPDLFKEEMGAFSVDFHTKDDRYAVFGSDPNGAGWPSLGGWDEDTEEFEEIDFFGIVAKHLQEGEVAVFMEVGAEKLRYLVGHAVAVAWTGETTQISIEDIYGKAAEEFVGCNPITVCEY